MRIQHFSGESNCKIFRKDINKSLNVHVNQLKPVDTRSRKAMFTEQQSVDSTPVDARNYIYDFDDDNEVNDIVRNRPIDIDINPAGDRQHAELHIPARPVQIDNTWVNMDRRNILPNRTRGVRPDYQAIAGGNQ